MDESEGIYFVPKNYAASLADFAAVNTLTRTHSDRLNHQLSSLTTADRQLVVQEFTQHCQTIIGTATQDVIDITTLELSKTCLNNGSYRNLKDRLSFNKGHPQPGEPSSNSDNTMQNQGAGDGAPNSQNLAHNYQKWKMVGAAIWTDDMTLAELKDRLKRRSSHVSSIA